MHAVCPDIEFGTVGEGGNILMAPEGDTSSVYYIHVYPLAILGGVGYFISLRDLRYRIKVPYSGWWSSNNGYLTNLFCCYVVLIVSEALTAKAFMDLLRTEGAISPAMCCIWNISWAYLW